MFTRMYIYIYMEWVYAHTFNDSVIRKYMINTRNCIKYFVIIYNEKESKKEYLFIYIYIYLNHFAVRLTHIVNQP